METDIVGHTYGSRAPVTCSTAFRPNAIQSGLGTMTTSPAACQWHKSIPCQFAIRANPGDYFDHEGRRLCRWHLPVDAIEALSNTDWQDELSRSGGDFRGVYLPQGSYDLPSRGQRFDVSFGTLAGGVELNIPTGASKPLLVRSRATGSLSIYDQSGVGFDLTGLTCEGPLIIRRGSQVRGLPVVSLREATLHGGLDAKEAFLGPTLRLDGAKLGGRIYLDDTGFPQNTTAHGLKFLKSIYISDNEGDFRSARLKFGTLGNRELEGIFYAMEKRCHRVGLPRNRPQALFARCISAWYDWLSAYGQSYERAFGWLAAVQIIFGIGYSVAVHGFALSLRQDASVWKFTIAQIVKPFDLLSARGDLPSFYAYVLGKSPSLCWILATATQSILSLSLIALFLLALRWRFKRG